MTRPDWSQEERDAERRARERNLDDDFGQADYSTDYAYDPVRRSGYRANEVGPDYGPRDYIDPASGHANRRAPEARDADRDYGRRIDEGDYRRDERSVGERAADQGRSWRDRASGFFGAARPERDERTAQRRNGHSDRVLWAVIVERLEDERGLDLRDVEVLVENGEVTLNGSVRRKQDKRRIEDIADIEGVRNVQNNLRPRERGWF